MIASRWLGIAICILPSGVAREAEAHEPQARTNASPPRVVDATPAEVLSAQEWRRVDSAVNRALAWLASQQRRNGSFPTRELGQPGVTSLCMMAFMAHGHLPGKGPYGLHLKRAANYILQCQKPNGLVTLIGPDGVRISRNVGQLVGVAAAYNHAISSLAISELYGMNETGRATDMQQLISKSIVATLEMHRWRKKRAIDQGGWQYLHSDNEGEDSDLSVTGWQLKFLRSAKNGGFDVPSETIDEAVAYVRRCYCKEYGAFGYAAGPGDSRSRGMAGAPAPEFWRMPMRDSTMRRRLSGRAFGSCSTTSTSTTRSSRLPRIGRTIVTTTVFSIAAKACTSWAAAIGSSFFRA
jgi:hypothetical protein